MACWLSWDNSHKPSTERVEGQNTSPPFSALSTCMPVASRVKDLGQPEWKGLCPQVHWHVYHLPEFYIKEGRRGRQIKIEGALNRALSFVSEYEKEEIKEAKAVQVRWMGSGHALQGSQLHLKRCRWGGGVDLMGGNSGHYQYWPTAISTFVRLYLQFLSQYQCTYCRTLG